MGHSGDTTQTGAPTGDRSRDPFAPPAAGAPDRPWQPRGPVVPQGGEHPTAPQQGGAPVGGAGAQGHGGTSGTSGTSGASGASGVSGTAQPEDDTAGTPEQDGVAGTPEQGATPGPQDGTPPARGRAHVPVPPPHPWSPGYQGQQPPTPRFQYQPPGPRFDPTDPVMRRSRYAVLCGIWGVPFMVLGIPYVSLLLGALAIYWGISALRGTPKPPNPLNGSPLNAGGALQGGVQGGAQGIVVPGQAVMPPTSPYHPAAQTRPQVPAALVGIVGGVVSLSLVAAVFAVQLYYKSYYDCQANALTKAAYDSCATSVSPRPPVWLTQFNGE